VPDTYRGTELWDDSLVDPDNRRPVDYRRREELLGRVNAATAAELWADPDDGGPKLLVTTRALGLRKERPASYGPEASYRPVHVTGDHANKVLAYLRGKDVAVVVPRLTLELEGWGDTRIELPAGTWVDGFTGAVVTGPTRVDEILASVPVAMLAKEH
jgi:(1->4)-alpha-D-glucan 1-alpha-D-glucosylmutase